MWFLKVTLGVLYAAAVRTYKNAKGEGRVGSIVLMDSSGDIKGTFFNDECDRWMETLKVNQVYKITGGNPKPADAKYNNCKSTFEITFNRDSTFEPLSDADAPRVVYDFMNIEMMEQKEAGTIIDVLGIVQVDQSCSLTLKMHVVHLDAVCPAASLTDALRNLCCDPFPVAPACVICRHCELQRVEPVGSVTVKTGANAGNQLAKREVVLVDQTMKTIKLTLWDENIHLVNEKDHHCPVIAIKNCKIGDFGGKSLSTTRSSMVFVVVPMYLYPNIRAFT